MKKTALFTLILLVELFCLAHAFRREPHNKSKEKIRNLKKNEKYAKSPRSFAEPRDMPDYRLPTSNLPSHQFVQLQPYIYVGNFTFDGYTEITFDCNTDTSNITIHQRGLTIDDTLTTVEQVGGGSIGVVSQTNDFDKEFYIIGLDQSLLAGQSYVLSITYVGPLNDVDDYGPGCFEGKYQTDGGATDVYYAMSDFEPIDFRACVPSFDEPTFKANFTTNIIREDHLLSASNGPLVSSTSLGNGWTRDEFQTTVRMATYLNAYHVSDFSFRSTSSDGTDYSVYVRPGFENATEYALQITPNITEELEMILNTPYAMPKQDQIALPELNTGAMENWGFITYTDYYLIYSEEISSAYDKQVICEVVSHELAHQWFGNLITNEWWTNLWLQEGFASYYEYVGCGKAEPTFEEDNIYMVTELHYCLGIDDVMTSNPLVYDLDHPDEIRGMFNSITYSKGSVMVRMMHYYLTVDTFNAAMDTYLHTYGFGNVLQSYLFEILNDQALADGTLDPSVNVLDIMNTWTLQMGYPVINITRNDDGTATLTQERFLIRTNESIVDTNDYKWYVPITYTTQSAPDFDTFDEFWMTPNDASMNISGLPSLSEWVIFNIQAGGYFRVNYDDSSWNLIFDQLNTDHTVINVKNRAQLINDAFNLATAGLIPYDYAFGASEYLRNELHYIPIDTALDELSEIDALMRRDTAYGSLKNFLFQFVQPAYEYVGIDDSLQDPQIDQLFRDLITEWACYLGYEPCLSDSAALYAQWMLPSADHSVIGNNIRATVYCAGVQEGTVTEWDFAYDRYQESEFIDEIYRLLYAMGCSKENWILTRYLDLAFNESGGFVQHRTDTIVEAVSESTLGEDIAWDYIRANDQAIVDYMGGPGSVGTYVYIIARKFSTQIRLDQLEQYRSDFVATFGDGPWVNPIDAAITNTEININWMSDNYDEIATWLTDNGY